MRMLRVAAMCVSLGLATGAAAKVAVADEREGYYYPPIGSEEIFQRELLEVTPPGPEVRERFIIDVTNAQLAAPHEPRFIVFEKGARSQHMIIVALDDEVFATLYRARAVLAQLTTNLRGSEFFEQTGLITEATWFDLAKLLGFEDVVISDGASWSHRVLLQ